MIIFTTVLLLILAGLPSGITEQAKINNNPYVPQQIKDELNISSILTVLAAIFILLFIILRKAE